VVSVWHGFYNKVIWIHRCAFPREPSVGGQNHAGIQELFGSHSQRVAKRRTGFSVRARVIHPASVPFPLLPFCSNATTTARRAACSSGLSLSHFAARKAAGLPPICSAYSPHGELRCRKPLSDIILQVPVRGFDSRRLHTSSSYKVLMGACTRLLEFSGTGPCGKRLSVDSSQ